MQPRTLPAPPAGGHGGASHPAHILTRSLTMLHALPCLPCPQAAKAVSRILRTSLGPKGMDKLLQGPDGDIVISELAAL